MGWYYGCNSRAEQIAELTPPEQTSDSGVIFRTLRKFTSGNVLWTVHEYGKAGEPLKRFIGCYLLGRAGGRWGYKPMEESMGPYYYSCPLAYLEMVPPPEGLGPEITAWRDKVRAYHKARAETLAARRERRKSLSIGPGLLRKYFE